ncbi:MAG TPA: SDR family oxidoreductase [Chthonomonadaceae bacterium]|nr:SDR family oxidoreductase [Chthonomonadaceae bacterium]
MEDLRGRTALVTGASGGIGGAIARAYAQQGMRVAIHYHSHTHAAQETLNGMPGEGHRLVQADLSDPEAVRRMIHSVAATFDGLDVLVNNAGIFEYTPFDTPDYADWQAGWKHVLDTNLLSAVNATYCVLPIMKAQGGGKIINIASRSAFRAETTAPAYAVSKAGMVNLTRCLARAEAQSGILSYCIAPGFVETAMARPGMDTMAAEILAQIPLGRIATVEDVAGVAVFLASSAANYLTGVTIPVTGGSWMST